MMVRGWVRGGATVALVGALCFGMPIAADALVNPVPLGEYVLGAVEAAAPVEAGSASVGPEGTLIATTAVALGAIAYDTRDTWMPWVAGLLGSGGANSAIGSGSTAYNLTISWSGPSSGDATQMDIHYACGNPGCGGDSTAQMQYTYQCKDTINGTITGNTIIQDYWLPNAGTQGILTGSTCVAGSTLTSADAVIRLPFSSGYTNHITWGVPFSPYTGGSYRVDMNCRKADGSTAVISATTVAPGNPSTPVDGVGGGGLLVPSCAAQFAGSHGEGLTVNGGQTGSPMHELSHQLFPTTSTAYPNCVGAGQACSYVVTYLGAPCVVGASNCVDWTRELLTHPADFGCLFGAYVMTMAQCNVDERVYEPGGVTLTQLNTDGNPNTYDAPIPAWAPQPTSVVAPAPAGAPGGAPAPVTGTQGAPGTTQVNNSDCWPSGAAVWNPSDWVLTPVKCALTWAFVPSTATLTSLGSGVTTDLTTAGIAPIVAAVNTNVGLIGTGTGCAGPSLTFAYRSVNKVITPFSACSEPMATIAGISKAVETVVIVGLGGFTALRLIGAGFGFDVSMGRGKDEGTT